MRVDRHLVLVLTEVLDRIGCSRVAVEARHHELLRKVVRSLLGERRIKGPQFVSLRLLSEKLTCFLNLLPDDLLDVLHARPFRGPVRPGVLEECWLSLGDSDCHASDCSQFEQPD